MTAVQITAWLSEAGNLFIDAESADKDTMKNLLQGKKESSKNKYIETKIKRGIKIT